ncbi:MAG TPA: cytochrome c biogenesis protein CcsA [Bacteroidota bacterium]|jgi:ABC-type transport system involved in cytochrome c biogenesis permease subunit|nr:cytochrome c biogenesis protein CcsA [Bacteroidota bacterium]
MFFLINLLEILLPLLYFFAIWAYAKAFFSGVKFAEDLKSILLRVVLGAHALYIILRATLLHHPPITSVFEILSLIAFTVVLVYAYIEFRTKNSATGYFILILPFFFQLISSLFIKEVPNVPPMLQSNLLGFHVSSAFLGYAAITISAVYGFLYLMLYHDIKSKQFGVIYKRLPNLETLERMSLTAAIFGFVLLTIAIIVGIIWLPRVFENFDYSDPKLFGTAAIWLIYAAGLVAKKVGGFQGRQMMVLSVAGFVVALLSITIINMFFTEFHKFY